ncbi:MAG: DUF4301 family protein, partial [Deltaproteobacteria bacterium]|nr:DUF4301 family protein [Deltaproteobacteria bacterium]
MSFSVQDARQLNKHGIPLAEAERQLNLLRLGHTDIKMDRPCTLGDGIVQLSSESFPRLNSAFDEASNAGRILRFVPASGAATRMFKELYAPHEEFEGFRKAMPSELASSFKEPMVRFFNNLGKFAFYEDLGRTMADEGQDLEVAIQSRQLELILEYLLQPQGLSY